MSHSSSMDPTPSEDAVLRTKGSTAGHRRPYMTSTEACKLLSAYIRARQLCDNENDIWLRVTEMMHNETTFQKRTTANYRDKVSQLVRAYEKWSRTRTGGPSAKIIQFMERINFIKAFDGSESSSRTPPAQSREADSTNGASNARREHPDTHLPLSAYETDSQSTESSSFEPPTVQSKKRRSTNNDLVEVMEVMANAASQLRELQKVLHTERMEFDSRLMDLKLENAKNLERIRFQHDMELEKLRTELQVQSQIQIMEAKFALKKKYLEEQAKK